MQAVLHCLSASVVGVLCFLSGEHAMYAQRGLLAVGDSVNDFTAAVHAVPSSKIFWICCTHGVIHRHAAILQLKRYNLPQKICFALLAKRLDYHPHFKLELGAPHWHKAVPSTSIFGAA